MDIRILGPVEITGPAGPVRLRRVGERLLLAALAVDVGEPVPAWRLLDLLGADGTVAPGTLVDYAGAVRRAIVAAGGDRTMLPSARRRGAYLLNLAPESVDFHRFLAAVRAAGARSATGDHRGAVERYHLALGMWSGEPLANVRGGAWLRQSITDRRREAGEALLAAQLHAGDHDAVHAAVLRAVHEETPTDRMIEMALHALARGGRHAEIPQFLDRAERRMATTVDARPGDHIRRLAEALLADPHRSTTPDAAPDAAPAGAAPGRPAARCTLPAGATAFTGRDGELRAIVEAAGRAARPGGATGIVVVDGMPGVGKTALAVHAAHRIAGWFPERQIYLDLHAHAAGRRPAEPADALAELLITDGVEPGHLPPTVDGRAALWRDRTAGTRTLLLLDDAACSDQVVPMLPGTGGSFTLVTSRRQLADLPADHLPLDTLPPGDATSMFLRLAPRAAGEVDRVRELVRVCGHLPLAVGITARLFARHRTWNVEQLLAEVRTRRLTVAAEHRSVRAAFDLSYQCLPERRRAMLRWLGLHPGEEIDAYAAAALAGVPDEQGLADLDALHEDHLIDEQSYRRYRMHDLIREYAGQLARVEAPAASAAIDRLLDHYERTALLAGAHLSRYGRGPTTRPAGGPELATADQAVAWLRAERANLLAGIEVARQRGDDRRVVGLTSGLGALLRLSGPWDLAAELHRAAADAAARLGDPGGQATALRDLGGIRLLTGDFAAAVGPLTQALAMVTAAGDAPGQADTLVELADVRMVTGDCRQATELTARARALYRAVGDRSGEALTLVGLGSQHYVLGDYAQAAELLEQAVQLYRTLGNQRGQANALRQLAAVRLIHADHVTATRLLTESLQLSRSLEHRPGVAISLGRLGVARRMAGDHEGAAVLLEDALRLQRELDDRHGAAITTVQLAVVRYLDGRFPEAERLLRQTVVELRELGAPDDEADARNHLGVLCRLTGRPGQALAEHERALDIASGIAYRLGRAQALDGLGRAATDLGQPARARLLMDRAGQAYAELGVPDAARLPGEAGALRLPKTQPPCLSCENTAISRCGTS